MEKPMVLVVGAGPSGLTMAIELKRAGLDVRIIDKADHPAIYSQALVVQARTLEQFQRYGVASEAIAKGRKLTSVKFFSEAREILAFSLDRISSRYPYALFLPQSETEAILTRHLQSLGVLIERQTELVGFEPDGEGISATLRHSSSITEETIHVRWLVGCDGAHSLIRTISGIPFEGDAVGMSFFLGDLALEGPDAPGDMLTLHMHRGNVVFMGRLSDRFTRVIVALHAHHGEDRKTDLSIQDFQRSIDEMGIRVKVLSADWMTPFHINDRQAAHYRSGNAFLVGDASHIHSPVGGQGMNTGIQDAANLAWKMAAVARGGNPRLLDSYEQERKAVGEHLLRFTERGLKFATTGNSILQSIRDALAPHLAQLSSVQEAMIGFISETSIEYRSSSAVHDYGGDGGLRAGDRMPDLRIGQLDQAPTLLQDWRDARYIVVLLNSGEDDRERIANAFAGCRIVSLHSVDLDDLGQALLGKNRKILIVRPDGHVGLRGRIDRPGEWNIYARQDGLTATAAATPHAA
jgi:2-polyprenyl-6-methoxyphenol hydroxylase-like FAD-dependent oxidoreductase